MASASVGIKLTPTEYETLLRALRAYKTVLHCILDKTQLGTKLELENLDAMAQARRVQLLLTKIGPD